MNLKLSRWTLLTASLLLPMAAVCPSHEAEESAFTPQQWWLVGQHCVAVVAHPFDGADKAQIL